MALDYRSEYERYRRYYMYLGPIIKNPIFQAYFSIVMSIFTIAIFVAFAIRPTLATIANLQRQIQDKQDINRRLDQKINDLSKLQSDYQTIERDLPLIFSALPQNPSVSKAIILLEKTATSAGVTLSAVNITTADYSEIPLATGAAVASISSSFVPINLTVVGDFDNIRNFLEQLTNLPRIFNPSNIGIVKSQDSSALDTRTEVNVYFLP